jgi:hypothetical protein
MKMDRKTREELNEMSKKVFKSSSRWQKLVNDGVLEPYERERKVMVPRNGGVVEKTFTDRKMVLRRYSVEEVRKLMQNMILDEIARETEKLNLKFE